MKLHLYFMIVGIFLRSTESSANTRGYIKITGIKGDDGKRFMLKINDTVAVDCESVNNSCIILPKFKRVLKATLYRHGEDMSLYIEITCSDEINGVWSISPHNVDYDVTLPLYTATTVFHDDTKLVFPLNIHLKDDNNHIFIKLADKEAVSCEERNSSCVSLSKFQCIKATLHQHADCLTINIEYTCTDNITDLRIYEVDIDKNCLVPPLYSFLLFRCFEDITSNRTTKDIHEVFNNNSFDNSHEETFHSETIGVIVGLIVTLLLSVGLFLFYKKGKLCVRAILCCRKQQIAIFKNNNEQVENLLNISESSASYPAALHTVNEKAATNIFVIDIDESYTALKMIFPNYDESNLKTTKIIKPKLDGHNLQAIMATIFHNSYLLNENYQKEHLKEFEDILENFAILHRFIVILHPEKDKKERQEEMLRFWSKSMGDLFWKKTIIVDIDEQIALPEDLENGITSCSMRQTININHSHNLETVKREIIECTEKIEVGYLFEDYKINANEKVQDANNPLLQIIQNNDNFKTLISEMEKDPHLINTVRKEINRQVNNCSTSDNNVLNLLLKILEDRFLSSNDTNDIQENIDNTELRQAALVSTLIKSIVKDCKFVISA